MNPNDLMPKDPAPVADSTDGPLVVVTVDYYRGGTIRVSCNAEGTKVPEMVKAILESALMAVENGRTQ